MAAFPPYCYSFFTMHEYGQQLSASDGCGTYSMSTFAAHQCHLEIFCYLHHFTSIYGFVTFSMTTEGTGCRTFS
jgi:hypothetical protein